jgi:hypothetical protein
VADLHTDVSQTPLALGAVRVDAALPVAHTAPAGVLGRALVGGTPGGDPDTALLGGRHTRETAGTGALHVLVENLAESIGSTGSLL